jgi:two-component system sensor histidine kinase DesK
MRRVRLIPPDSHLGWMPYTWLVYLGFYFVVPVLAGFSAARWAGAIAGAAVFLPLYFRAFWLEGARLLPIVGAIAAIGVVLIPFNPGASVFFVYAAGFLGDVARPAVAVRWLGLLLAIVGVEAWALGLPIYAWAPAVVFSILVGGPNIFLAESRRANRRLRLAQEEVERLAKLAERERIARDLHDVLGHTLSVIVLKSELASKLASRDPESAAREIREVEQISREALAEVRRAIQGYRAHGLAEEIAVARRALAAAGVALECEVDPVALDAVAESALALALREAVTNVVRHARATHCRVRIGVRDGRAQLEVADDGVGGDAPDGSGLAGMRARAAELGGTVEREGAAGTLVRVSLPAGARS